MASTSEQIANITSRCGYFCSGSLFRRELTTAHDNRGESLPVEGERECRQFNVFMSENICKHC